MARVSERTGFAAEEALKGCEATAVVYSFCCYGKTLTRKSGEDGLFKLTVIVYCQEKLREKPGGRDHGGLFVISLFSMACSVS